MDSRSRAAVEMVFKGPGKGTYIITDEESADAGIVDLDGAGAGDLWSGYRQRYPDRPVIVLSLDECRIDGVLYLRKPISINSLLQTLQQVREQLEGTAMASASPAPAPQPQGPEGLERTTEPQAATPTQTPSSGTRTAERPAVPASPSAAIQTEPDSLRNDPVRLKSLLYRPEDYVGWRVLRVLKTSIRDCIAREITCWMGFIVVLPKQQTIVTNLTDARLKQLGLMRLSEVGTESELSPLELQIRAIDHGVNMERLLQELPNDSRDDTVQMPAETFLWKLAIYLSRGRVPIGTDLTAPILLKYWPNMTRLRPTPHALRIAALWIARSRSLLDTAAVLKIPITDALDFYSAASAIDLITDEKRQVGRLFEPGLITEHRRRSLLQRILGRLLGGP